MTERVTFPDNDHISQVIKRDWLSKFNNLSYEKILGLDTRRLQTFGGGICTFEIVDGEEVVGVGVMLRNEVIDVETSGARWKSLQRSLKNNIECLRGFEEWLKDWFQENADAHLFPPGANVHITNSVWDGRDFLVNVEIRHGNEVTPILIKVVYKMDGLWSVSYGDRRQHLSQISATAATTAFSPGALSVVLPTTAPKSEQQDDSGQTSRSFQEGEAGEPAYALDKFYLRGVEVDLSDGRLESIDDIADRLLMRALQLSGVSLDEIEDEELLFERVRRLLRMTIHSGRRLLSIGVHRVGLDHNDSRADYPLLVDCLDLLHTLQTGLMDSGLPPLQAQILTSLLNKEYTSVTIEEASENYIRSTASEDSNTILESLTQALQRIARYGLSSDRIELVDGRGGRYITNMRVHEIGRDGSNLPLTAMHEFLHDGAETARSRNYLNDGKVNACGYLLASEYKHRLYSQLLEQISNWSDEDLATVMGVTITEGVPNYAPQSALAKIRAYADQAGIGDDYPIADEQMTNRDLIHALRICRSVLGGDIQVDQEMCDAIWEVSAYWYNHFQHLVLGPNQVYYCGPQTQDTSSEVNIVTGIDTGGREAPLAYSLGEITFHDRIRVNLTRNAWRANLMMLDGRILDDEDIEGPLTDDHIDLLNNGTYGFPLTEMQTLSVMMHFVAADVLDDSIDANELSGIVMQDQYMVPIASAILTGIRSETNGVNNNYLGQLRECLGDADEANRMIRACVDRVVRYYEQQRIEDPPSYLVTAEDIDGYSASKGLVRRSDSAGATYPDIDLADTHRQNIERLEFFCAYD